MNSNSSGVNLLGRQDTVGLYLLNETAVLYSKATQRRRITMEFWSKRYGLSNVVRMVFLLSLLCQALDEVTGMALGGNQNVAEMEVLRWNKTPPNIVLFVADDLGVGEVGFIDSNSKHRKLRTPFIDRLGKQGMRFSHAYAGYCVCAPSRTTLFTGYHSGHFRRKLLNGIKIKAEGVDSRVELLPRLLKKSGYQTAMVGKSAPLSDPMNAGFDFFIGQADQAVCHNMYPSALDLMHGRMNYQLPLNQKFR